MACKEGCTTTWNEYSRQKQKESWTIAALVSHGVFDHLHLSSNSGKDVNGVYIQLPIWWICNAQYRNSNCPSEKTSEDVLRQILDNGGDANTRDYTGATPIMYVRDPVLFATLVSYGAQIDAVDYVGSTLLHFIVRDGDMEFIRNIWRYPEVQRLVSVEDVNGHTSYGMVADKYKIYSNESIRDILVFLRDGTPPPFVTKRAIR